MTELKIKSVEDIGIAMDRIIDTIVNAEKLAEQKYITLSPKTKDVQLLRIASENVNKLIYSHKNDIENSACRDFSHLCNSSKDNPDHVRELIRIMGDLFKNSAKKLPVEITKYFLCNLVEAASAYPKEYPALIKVAAAAIKFVAKKYGSRVYAHNIYSSVVELVKDHPEHLSALVEFAGVASENLDKDDMRYVFNIVPSLLESFNIYAENGASVLSKGFAVASHPTDKDKNIYFVAHHDGNSNVIVNFITEDCHGDTDDFKGYVKDGEDFYLSATYSKFLHDALVIADIFKSIANDNIEFDEAPNKIQEMTDLPVVVVDLG